MHPEALKGCGRKASEASTLPRRAGSGACSSPTPLPGTAACGSRIRKPHPRQEPLWRFAPPPNARRYEKPSWNHLHAVPDLLPIGNAPSPTSVPNQERQGPASSYRIGSPALNMRSIGCFFLPCLYDSTNQGSLPRTSHPSRTGGLARRGLYFSIASRVISAPRRRSRLSRSLWPRSI